MNTGSAGASAFRADRPPLPRRNAGTASGRHASAWNADRLYRIVLRALATTVFAIFVLMVFEMARGAAPTLQAFGARFLVTSDWDPVFDKFGAVPYIYGTLVSSALALLLALPPSLFAAVYLAELARPRLGAVLSFVIELLASIPSIVYGIWGMFVLAPWLRTAIEPWLIAHLGFMPLFQGFPFGLGMLNAAIVLAIMITPTIVSLSREILLATPGALREAALALGATRAEAIAVTLGAARPGIVGVVILALGRALGETMAVTMVIGNTNHMSASLLAPGATMASVIANEFAEAADPLHLAALFEIALLLFALTLVVNGLAHLLVLWTLGGRRDVARAT